MNSLLPRFDKMLLKQLVKHSCDSVRIIIKPNHSNFNYGHIRSYYSTCKAVTLFKSKRKDSYTHALYSFAAAISLAKIYEIIGIDDNKEVKKLIHKAKQHLEVRLLL